MVKGEGHVMDPVVKPPAKYQAYRIEKTSTNRLVIVFDPIEDKVPFIHCVEIWDEGGAQPPNVHQHAEEIFYILKGRAVAHCDGKSFELEPGDSFLARRGQTHQIVNAGPGRLYALCTMIPDDQFAALIRSGVPAELDAEDLAVLRRLQ
jgi:mannose-6-phosphate isomerase-like protein (cupin superfamily)